MTRETPQGDNTADEFKKEEEAETEAFLRRMHKTVEEEFGDLGEGDTIETEDGPVAVPKGGVGRLAGGALTAVAGVAGLAAWKHSHTSSQPFDFSQLSPEAAGSISKDIERQKEVVRQYYKQYLHKDLTEQEVTNVTSFMKTIMVAEGTLGNAKDPTGYRVKFGSDIFHGDAHPNESQNFSGGTTTAAGGYQFLFSTWEGAAKARGLTKFSDHSQQDVAALYLMEQKGSLMEIAQGNFREGIHDNRSTWASFPGAGYKGQSEQPMERLEAAYQHFGGKFGGEDLVASATPQQSNGRNYRVIREQQQSADAKNDPSKKDKGHAKTSAPESAIV
jgi:muramidase (phage lysozyme)